VFLVCFLPAEVFVRSLQSKQFLPLKEKKEVLPLKARKPQQNLCKTFGRSLCVAGSQRILIG
jgi:hypothetical protein